MQIRFMRLLAAAYIRSVVMRIGEGDMFFNVFFRNFKLLNKAIERRSFTG